MFDFGALAALVAAGWGTLPETTDHLVAVPVRVRFTMDGS